MVRPHALHIGVILSSEEIVAAVCSHHVFIHCELDLSPEFAVLLWAHGQSEKDTPTPKLNPAARTDEQDRNLGKFSLHHL